MDDWGASTAYTQDWEVLRSFLPAGWEDKARELGALRRARNIKTAEVLLRVLLIHLATGASLKETQLRAGVSGLCKLSSVAVFKRLRAAENWLGWMCGQMLATWSSDLPSEVHQAGQRLRIVDSTALREPGRTGTRWRIRYALDFPALRCRQVHVSDPTQGESLRMFSIASGEIVLADRGYANPADVAHVEDQQASLIVRAPLTRLALREEEAGPFRLLEHLRTLAGAQTGDWPAWVQYGRRPIAGRLCAIRKSEAAAEPERKRIRRAAAHKGIQASAERMEAAGYFFVFTTLGPEVPTRTVLELDRGRWQVELAFKRLKSLIGLSHLKKRDAQGARAWIHGKLLVAFLIEALLAASRDFSPWGYFIPDPHT